MNRRLHSLLIVSSALLLVLVPVVGHGDDAAIREAAVRAVTTWDNNCTSTNVSDWASMVQRWYDEITNDSPSPLGHGSQAWDRSGFQQNGNIVDSDFTDDSKVSWGNDDAAGRPDAVDAFMGALHGGCSGNWCGRVRVDESGTGNCNTCQNHIVLGDEDLEFLHLSSCCSMDKEDWSKWPTSVNGLRAIYAFHGIMFIGRGFYDDYRDFADDAFEMGIAKAWVDNMYETNVRYRTSGGGEDVADQCPVAMAAGPTSSSVADRQTRERYQFVFPTDPPPSGTPRRDRWLSPRPCDPAGQPAL